MPMGTKHKITGMLCWGPVCGFVLHTDGGAEWELDFPAALRDPAEEHLHSRVTVEGVRSGFNILDVHVLRRSTPDGDVDMARRPWWVRLFG